MKEKLLLSIFQSKEVGEVLRKISRPHLADDIKQHVFLSLLEKPEAEILDLHERGKLKAYVVKMIYNTDRWGSTTFGKQMQFTAKIDPLDEIPELADEPYLEPDTTKEEAVEDFIREMDKDIEEGVNIQELPIKPLELDMVRLYADWGNYRKVKELTGIPIATLHRAVKKFKHLIKSRYEPIPN